MLQTLSILKKFEPTETKIGGELALQTFMDKLIFFTQPQEWIYDWECLLQGSDAKELFFIRLILTLTMPITLLVTNVIMIWMITFFVKFCSFR